MKACKHEGDRQRGQGAADRRYDHESVWPRGQEPWRVRAGARECSLGCKQGASKLAWSQPMSALGRGVL